MPSARDLRVTVICDMREEGWISMDLVADMLLAELRTRGDDSLSITEIRPVMRRRLGRANTSGWRFAADRALGRFVDYPRLLRGPDTGADVFHIADHSYAHLAHSLPKDRLIVSCHDLDAFRPVLEPQRDQRSWPYRFIARRALQGLQRASEVHCISETVRDEIIRHGIVAPDRLHVTYLGVHPDSRAERSATADAAADALLGTRDAAVSDLLHVGSTIPRKRIDLLLHVFAEVRRRDPAVRLIRAGGPFTDAQESLIDTLDLRRSIVVLPYLSRPVLAAIYRRAAVVLMPSESEGFGLPVAEALACGTAVVASDIPVLREGGGDATEYVPVGDISAWADRVMQLVAQQRHEPAARQARRERGILHASRFSWTAYAAGMSQAYRRVAAAAGR